MYIYTHLLHYIPPTAETSGPRSVLKSIFALYVDSDEVTESEGNDQDDSFFTSQPVAEDLDLGEGMLLVRVILSGANSVTHLIMRRLKT